MHRIRARFLLVAVFVGIVAANGGANASAFNPRGACTGVEGRLTWSLVGDAYQVHLDVPIPSPLTSSPVDCTATTGAGTAITHVFGSLTGTVTRLGSCDARPAPPGVDPTEILGLDLAGTMYFYQPSLRRITAHPFHFAQRPLVGLFDIFPASFGGPTPIAGRFAFDGDPVSGSDVGPFNFVDTMLIHTRVNGICPPGGDPKAKLDLQFQP